MGKKNLVPGELPKGIKSVEKLKSQLAFYEKVFSSLNAIVFVFDLSVNRMVWVNEGFRKILGYRKSTAVIPEQELIDVHHPDDRDFLHQMREFFRKNKTGTFTSLLKFKTANDEFIWLCSSATLFRRTADESVFEVVGVSLDFTKPLTYNRNLKLLSQEKLRELNADSLKRITNREKEILKYFANGLNAREISEKTGLSFHTVNNHRKNMLKKLELKNLAALVNFAVDNGLA